MEKKLFRVRVRVYGDFEYLFHAPDTSAAESMATSAAYAAEPPTLMAVRSVRCADAVEERKCEE